MKTPHRIESLSYKHPIVCYDGICRLCQASIQLIIRHDPNKRFRFAHLQDEVLQTWLTDQDEALQTLKTVALIDNGQLYIRSDAGLRIAQQLSGWPRLLAIGRWLPRFLRDPIYNWIASNRYRWFGRRVSCWMPTPEVSDRFLTPVSKAQTI